MFGSSRGTHKSGAMKVFVPSSLLISMKMESFAPAPVNGAKVSVKSLATFNVLSASRFVNCGTGICVVLPAVTVGLSAVTYRYVEYPFLASRPAPGQGVFSTAKSEQGEPSTVDSLVVPLAAKEKMLG